jgi:hypothetical protein
MLKQRALVCAVLSAALSACGGGGSSSPGAVTQVQPPTTAGSAVALSIHIPARTTTYHGRVLQFVSASTSGIAVSDSIHGSSNVAYSTSADLSSGSASCSAASGGGRNCTVSLNAPVGSADFSITTYDVAPSSGNFGNAADVLGKATVTATIVANTTNTVNIALGGVPVTLQLTISQPTFNGEVAASVPVGVTALDADSNIIVAGTNTVTNGGSQSTDTYANPITLSLSENLGSGKSLFSLNGGANSSTAIVTKSSDVVTLNYDGSATNTGYNLTVFASATGATQGSIFVSPLVLLSQSGTGAFTRATSPTLVFGSSNIAQTLHFYQVAATPNYTVSLLNSASTNCPSGAMTLDSSTLASKTFTITSGTVATQGTGCAVALSDGITGVITTMVSLPSPLTLSQNTVTFGIIPTNVGCNSNSGPDTNNNCAGDITVTISGGTPPYSFGGTSGSCNAGVYHLPAGSTGTRDVTGIQITISQFGTGTGTCSGNVTDAAGGSVPLTVVAAHQLFVGNFSNNAVLVFNPPFTNSSAAVTTVTNGVNGNGGVAFDSSGNMYVANFVGGNVTIYHPPFTNASTPSVTIGGLANCGGLALDGSGNLYALEDLNNAVQIFTPPFTNSSLPGTSITIGLSTPQGIGFDGSGNLWVTNHGGSIVEYTPPFGRSSSPVVTINGPSGPYLAFDSGGNLYVGNNSNSVSIYNPPFGPTSPPSAAISGLTNPSGIAFDASGNLYVTTGNSVNIYAPPFSNSSTPTTTINGFNNPSGVAIH